MNPTMPTGYLGSNLVYDFMNLGESLFGGQAINSALPNRPDQPECRYFMSTGTCKYGSDCKFHHPKERISQSLINPLGLPVRPVSSASPKVICDITFKVILMKVNKLS